jgi:hypothetical protein
MKKLVVFILVLMISSAGFSQRVLEWSIGKAKITCGDPVLVSYPLLVSINSSKGSPVLGSTTMRFIYDASSLNNFSIQNIENGYTESGLSQSNPVLGDVFGFSSIEGVFVQFDIMDNAIANPIYLTGNATHILDFTFEIDADAAYPLCIPFVLDNNPDGWGQGIDQDDGFLPGSSGIVGSYFLSQDYTNAIDADDEVKNLSWESAKSLNGNVSAKFGKVEIGKTLGREENSGCIEKNICGELGQVNIDYQNNIWQAEGESSFSVFPVPFIDEVNVKYAFDYDTKVTLEVFDAKGTLIRKIENDFYTKDDNQNQHRIDLSAISSQFLIVRLTTNKSSETKKILSIDNIFEE